MYLFEHSHSRKVTGNSNFEFHLGFLEGSERKLGIESSQLDVLFYCIFCFVSLCRDFFL